LLNTVVGLGPKQVQDKLGTGWQIKTVLYSKKLQLNHWIPTSG